MKTPQNGETVLLKLRAQSKCTDGRKGFVGPWHESTVTATYCDKPFPSESGHFHGNFGVSDDDCQRHHRVELVEWIGFSGGGRLGE